MLTARSQRSLLNVCQRDVTGLITLSDPKRRGRELIIRAVPTYRGWTKCLTQEICFASLYIPLFMYRLIEAFPKKSLVTCSRALPSPRFPDEPKTTTDGGSALGSEAPAEADGHEIGKGLRRNRQAAVVLQRSRRASHLHRPGGWREQIVHLCFPPYRSPSSVLLSSRNYLQNP